MKRLLFILAILLTSTTWSKGQIFNTGQTIPTGATPLQSPDNISFYLNKPDTTLRGKLGRFGGYELWSAKKIQNKLNAKQDTITLTTDGTGAATFDGQNLNIPIYSGVVSDATTTTKGIIQLAGDLSGTSASPTVVGLSLKAPLTLFDGLNSGYLPYWNGTKFVNSYLQYNGVNSLYIAGIYSATGGMIRLRDTYATGSNQTFMGMEFNSSPGFDWTIGKYSNYTEGLFQIRDQSDGIALSINESHQVTLPYLSGTEIQDVVALPDGTLSVTATAANNLINTPQEKSGTSVSLDYSLGRNMNITLTGSTTITMSNLVAGGLAGEIHVINAASVAYPITFAGYLFEITQAVWKSGDTVVTSGLGKSDHYTYYYNGTTVEILGVLGLKIGLRP